MVDKITKALRKLSPKERKHIARVLKNIQKGAVSSYDVKKLKGRHDIYRVRSGKMRILFRVDDQKEIYILAVERRSDTTYHL